MPTYNSNNNSSKIIRYLNKDFGSFLNDLTTFSRTYFPNTFTDFSPASPARIFMEMSAYVGDVLAFYLDNQIQENFLLLARQSDNIYQAAYMYGYKPKLSNAASGDLNIFQQIPAIFDGTQYVPDYSYTIKVPQYTSVRTGAGNEAYRFYTLNDLDFSVSSSIDPTELTVYEIDGSGNPIFFLLKKTTKITSGNIVTRTLQFNEYEEFPSRDISAPTFLNMIDVIDSDGNVYYEVDYLGQETIFRKEPNKNYLDPNKTQNIDDAPYVLSAIKSERRYILRVIDSNTIRLQFGSGRYSSGDDEDIIPNQNNVGLGLPYEQNRLTTAYSPQNFIFTNSYGIAPSNTTIQIRMFAGGGIQTNSPANSINIIDATLVRFNNVPPVSTTANYVINSLSCNNPDALTGGRGGDTLAEIKENSLSSYGSQLRTVTLDDYIIRALSLPSIYGRIGKVYAQKPQLSDQQTSTIETVNLYVLGENAEGRLTYLTNTVKENIRTYLNEYKMVGDTVEIRDAYIINIGVDFEIITQPNYNANIVLSQCIIRINEYFDLDKWNINQPIEIRNLYNLLDRVEGVQTVNNIEITNKVGEDLGYSQYSYDIHGATINRVVYPALDPCIFEVRFPRNDIRGKVVSF
jgi:hypothetical protein